MAKLVSKTYGEALFETAEEAGRTGQMLEELTEIQKLFSENPEFDRLLKHPGIPKHEKLKVIENVFEGRVCQELAGFLKIVIEKERYRDFPAICSYFTDKVKQAEKIGVAYVTAAAELTPGQKDSIKAKLLETTDYETMEIHYKTDASLIGGMVIRINDRVVDSSVKSKLENLTRQLLKIQLG